MNGNDFDMNDMNDMYGFQQPNTNNSFSSNLQNMQNCNAYSSTQGQNVGAATRLAILASATQQQLMAAGNPAYMDIWVKYTGMVDRMMNAAQTAPIAPPSIKIETASVHAPAPSGQLPLLARVDYTDVRFWRREVWGQHYAEQDNAGKAPCRTGFIEGSNGICVSDERKRQMSTTVYAVLNQLHSENRAPQKWGAAGDQIHSYAANVLGTKYSEFRYCDDGSWKALEFIKHKFSDWDRNYRKSGKLDDVQIKMEPVTARKRAIKLEETDQFPDPRAHRKKRPKPAPLTKRTKIYDSDSDGNIIISSSPPRAQSSPTGSLPPTTLRTSPPTSPILISSRHISPDPMFFSEPLETTTTGPSTPLMTPPATSSKILALPAARILTIPTTSGAASLSTATASSAFSSNIPSNTTETSTESFPPDNSSASTTAPSMPKLRVPNVLSTLHVPKSQAVIDDVPVVVIPIVAKPGRKPKPPTAKTTKDDIEHPKPNVFTTRNMYLLRLSADGPIKRKDFSNLWKGLSDKEKKPFELEGKRKKLAFEEADEQGQDDAGAGDDAEG